MGKKLVTTVVAGATVGGGLALLPSPAGADNATCDSGEFCLWEDSDFNNGEPDNHVRQWEGNDPSYDNNNWFDANAGIFTSDILDDEASSAQNNGNSCDVWLWQNADYGGAVTKFDLGDKDGNLGNNEIGHDRASSHHWCTPRP